MTKQTREGRGGQVNPRYRRQCYGRWYIQPRAWDQRLQERMTKDMEGDMECEGDKARNKLGVSLDCKKVDANVAQLHSTKVTYLI